MRVAYDSTLYLAHDAAYLHLTETGMRAADSHTIDVIQKRSANSYRPLLFLLYLLSSFDRYVAMLYPTPPRLRLRALYVPLWPLAIDDDTCFFLKAICSLVLLPSAECKGSFFRVCFLYLLTTAYFGRFRISAGVQFWIAEKVRIAGRIAASVVL